jgi:hypothetical protein
MSKSRYFPPPIRSAKALRVPGTFWSALSTRLAASSIDARSGASTWMPRGLRTPVASISVRVWIGIHQTFGIPVN